MFKKLSALLALLVLLSIFAACNGAGDTSSPSESETTSVAASSKPESSKEPSVAPSSKPAPSKPPVVVAPPSQAPAVSRVSPAEELSRKTKKKQISDFRYISAQFFNDYLNPTALAHGFERSEIIEGISATADLIDRNPAAAALGQNAEFYIANFYAPSGWRLSIYYGIDKDLDPYLATVYYRPSGTLGGLGSYDKLTDAQVSKYLQTVLKIFEEGNCPSYTLLREMKNLA